MYTKFGIFRDGNLMTQGLDEIQKIRANLGNISISDKGRGANQALVRYLELENMVPVAEAVAQGAILRQESRGSHTRTDYTLRDDDHFLNHSIARYRDGEISITYAPVTLGVFLPEERVY